MQKLSIILLGSFCCLPLFGAPALRLISDSTALSAQGNNHSSNARISRDGSAIAFESSANNLLSSPITNRYIQVYARPNSNAGLELASAATDGAPAKSDSFLAGISKNGDVLLFESSAGNLPGATGSTASTNLYVRILSTHETRLVTGDGAGSTVTGSSRNGHLSGNGNYVLFESTSPGLGASMLPASGNYLYRRDVFAGSTRPAGTNFYKGDTSSSLVHGSLSLDGRFAVYGVSSNETSFVAVEDFTLNTVQLVWTNNFANQISLSNLQISDDGRYIAFAASDPSNLTSTVYFEDLQGKILAQVNNCDYIIQKGEEFGPQLSSNGRYLSYMKAGSIPPSDNAFAVWDSSTGTEILSTPGLFGRINATGNLVTFLAHGKDYGFGSSSTTAQVLQINRTAGVTNLLSASNGNTQPRVDASGLGVSEDGASVVFESPDSDLISDDQNRFIDIFSRVVSEANCTLVSKSSTAALVNLLKPDVQILGLVEFSNKLWSVVFDSWKHFNPASTNTAYQILLSDVSSGQRLLVTTNLDGLPFYGTIGSPAFSKDGKFFVFNSVTTDFASDKSQPATNHLYLYNQATRSVKNLTADLPTASPGFSDTIPSISSDGGIIGFVREGTNYLYFTDSDTREILSITTANVSPTVSPNGALVAFEGPSGYSITNRALHTSRLNLNAGSLGSRPRGVFTPNNKFLIVAGASVVFDTSTYQSVSLPGVKHPSVSGDDLLIAYDTLNANVARDLGSRDVYVWNTSDHSFELISESWDGTRNGDADSDSPSISADGRYVLFRSRARNLIPGVTNGLSSIYLKDRVTHSLSLVAGGLGDDQTLATSPFFSPDGKVIFYRIKTDPGLSTASDVTAAAFYIQFKPTAFVDTDNDGMDDAWEIKNFGNLSHNGQQDSDGDGVSDLQEYLAGTNPMDSHSVFKGLPLNIDDQGRISLTWKATLGKSYKVQYKNTLSDSQWIDINPGIAFAGDQAHAADLVGSGVGSRFYRIVEIP